MPAAVVGELVRDRADDRELVGNLRVSRQVFADVDAGDVGLDRPELAAILRRGVRLHVVGFHVRRAARQPDEDDGGVVGGLVGAANLVRGERTERGTGERDRAKPQKIPAIRTGAMRRTFQHATGSAGWECNPAG